MLKEARILFLFDYAAALLPSAATLKLSACTFQIEIFFLLLKHCVIDAVYQAAVAT